MDDDTRARHAFVHSDDEEDEVLVFHLDEDDPGHHTDEQEVWVSVPRELFLPQFEPAPSPPSTEPSL